MKNYLSRGKNLLVIILLMNMVFIFNSEKIKNLEEQIFKVFSCGKRDLNPHRIAPTRT